MPGISTEYLAQQIQETNRRLAEAIDAFRDETIALRDGLADVRADLKTEIGKINTSLYWMKVIGGSFAAILTAAALGVLGLAYQAGHEMGRLGNTVASLKTTTEELRSDFRSMKTTTEELRSDFKARDKVISDALVEMRKASEEARAGIKGQSADIARIQGTLDRLDNKLAEMMKSSRPN